MNRSFPQLSYARLARWAGLLVLFAVVLAACAPAATAVPTAVVPVTGANGMPAAEASIAIATDPKYGKILVDGKGMTLYMYTKDAPGVSNCSGGCAKAWPPLFTQGSPILGAGVDASLIGSAALADGTKIVTYNKMPLYYWAKDTKPGDITGLGVGGVWYLVSDTGKITGAEATINVATDPK